MAFLHTFSIVARDPINGQLGVAVQTHWFAVGALCPWAEAGVGAIATQSIVEMDYGPLGLAALRSGKKPHQVLEELLAEDKERELRQVAILGADGQIAVHTGARCIQAAGHQTGAGFSVQANMMLNDSVWPAMASAFEASIGSLAERMLTALKAGQAAGGDIRGMQSAAMLVVDGKKSNKPWKNILVNLRVDDAEDPINELERLLHIQQAYDLMNEGDNLLAVNKIKAAKEKYHRAARLSPDIDEIRFWQAVTMVESGSLSEALPIFKEVFNQNPIWIDLVRRLPAAGLMTKDSKVMTAILTVQEKKGKIK